MSFLDRLLGRRPDPTSGWPPASNAPLAGFAFARRAFGPLAFGDALESAKSFGRPDRLTWIDSEPDYCALLYARHGFQIDFEHGRFAYVAFFLGPDPFLPSHPQVTFAQPHLDDRLQLTPATTGDQLKACFGPPETVDTDEDETILFYAINGVTAEFEFGPKGALKRCNLFPK